MIKYIILAIIGIILLILCIAIFCCLILGGKYDNREDI